MHMAFVGVEDGFISAQVSEYSLSAEITHLARKPIPYAFSRTLQVFKHFRILCMAHFMTHIPRYAYLGIGVIMGNVIKSERIAIVSQSPHVMIHHVAYTAGLML